jgi:hypothetical protein
MTHESLPVDNLSKCDKKQFSPGLYLWISLWTMWITESMFGFEGGRLGCSRICIVSCLKSIGEANILPVTSACNSRCVFCSHLQNPPRKITVYTLPPLGKEEILALADFLDPGQRIIIGRIRNQNKRRGTLFASRFLVYSHRPAAAFSRHADPK